MAGIEPASNAANQEGVDRSLTASGKGSVEPLKEHLTTDQKVLAWCSHNRNRTYTPHYIVVLYMKKCVIRCNQTFEFIKSLSVATFRGRVRIPLSPLTLLLKCSNPVYAR
jgi:hypothetical protein